MAAHLRRPGSRPKRAPQLLSRRFDEQEPIGSKADRIARKPANLQVTLHKKVIERGIVDAEDVGGGADALVAVGRAERLGLHDDEADVVGDHVVELLGDPDALLCDGALGEQLTLARQGW